MREPFWALLLLPLVFTARTVVPGCPSVDILENDENVDENTLKNLLLCFCEVTERTNVLISCLYGSNPDHLERATEAVKNASMTTTAIHIQHMDFPDSGVPALGELAPELKSIEIRECTSSEPLAITREAFKGLEGKLLNVTIHSCNLMEVPEALNSLVTVKNLDLSANKLQQLDPKLFENKKELRYLDISNNQLGNLADGTFAPLEMLTTLVAGDHNFMNETFLEEIGNLKSLKVLDLSRADGLFEPPMDLFNSLPELEELKLSGCSIPKIDPGVFSPLKNLKMLDLRVNLIENVSAYAFDGLKNLERLTLAGNYIRELDGDTWAGLDSLTELDVGWNELKELPAQLFHALKDNLKTLNVRHNPFTTFPATGLPNLETLQLSECQLDHLDSSLLAEYGSLKNFDVSGCNLTTIAPDTFKAQADTLKVLNLSKNHLKTVPQEMLKDLPALEELDISRNPFLCDDKIGAFVSAVEERYKQAAKDGKDFLLSNGNETSCARPYTLKGQPVFEVDQSKLIAYDESADTTTTSTPATTGAFVEEESTTAFNIPNLFVGQKTNESLFKDESWRHNISYSLHDADNIKGSGSGSGPITLITTAAVLGLITLISVVAVGLFIKKRRTVEKNKVVPKASPGPKKAAPGVSVEDGMEEIELNTRS